MYGIVTIVEGTEGDAVSRLWRNLAETHGAGAIAGFNIPHLSYHVAEQYDLAAVRRLVEETAQHSKAFDVPTVGIGFIASPYPITFINLTRTPALSRVHKGLWQDASQAATGVIERYHTDVWFPHVTLSDTPELLGALPFMARELFSESGALAKVSISNLSVVEELEHGHELRLRVPLAAPASGS